MMLGLCCYCVFRTGICPVLAVLDAGPFSPVLWLPSSISLSARGSRVICSPDLLNPPLRVGSPSLPIARDVLLSTSFGQGLLYSVSVYIIFIITYIFFFTIYLYLYTNVYVLLFMDVFLLCIVSFPVLCAYLILGLKFFFFRAFLSPSSFLRFNFLNIFSFSWLAFHTFSCSILFSDPLLWVLSLFCVGTSIMFRGSLLVMFLVCSV